MSPLHGRADSPRATARRRAEIQLRNQLVVAVIAIHRDAQRVLARGPVARIVVPSDPFGIKRGLRAA